MITRMWYSPAGWRRGICQPPLEGLAERMRRLVADTFPAQIEACVTAKGAGLMKT